MMKRYFFPALSFLAGLVVLSVMAAHGGSAKQAVAEPWRQSQVMRPAALAELLRGPEGRRPAVVCVGFDFLYKSGHVPGAKYFGAGSTPDGIRSLEDWARGAPRGRSLVIYCGCCPWRECPNIRPVFAALKRLGFTRLRVLRIDQDFAHDWIQKDYPVEKGK